MPGDDAAWLLDMFIACEKIERFIHGVDGAAFLGDELRQEAVLRQLTVPGEAAKNVSSKFRVAHPQIPWQDMARFRGTSWSIGIDAYNWASFGRF